MLGGGYMCKNACVYVEASDEARITEDPFLLMEIVPQKIK